MKTHFARLAAIIGGFALAALDAHGVGFSYSENFDEMAAGTVVPNGWSVFTIAGNSNTWIEAIPASAVVGGTANTALIATTTFDANTRSAAQGYNFALAASPTDRALGTSPTGLAGTALQLSLTNTTGAPIDTLRVGYKIRRFLAASAANELPGYWLFYSLDGGSTWTNVNAFNPVLSGSGVVVPNSEGVTIVAPAGFALGSPWANGATLLLRWVDDNSAASSPDQIIGLDNVVIDEPVGALPTVALTSPSASDVFIAPATIDLQANAADTGGTVAKVEFFQGATKLGEDLGAPYTWTLSGATAGVLSFTAVATDDDGNVTVSAPVQVYVNSIAGSGVLSRGPYLQKAAPTQMTIRWRSSQGIVGRVRFGVSAANLDQAVKESAATTEHGVTLSGLNAATTYFYSVGSASDTLASGSDYTFTTPPAVGTAQNTRVWVLGDAGTASANQSAVRDAFYTWTGARIPDLVLQLGDNAYNSGLDAEFQSAVFDMYPTMLRRTPFWSCLGNHETAQATAFVDTYPYFNIYTFPTSGECGGVASGTEHYYSFDYGNIHFISLDSMTASRSPTGAMAVWLQNDLASTTATWVVCFFHHPPYTKGSHNSDTETELIQMRENILPILEAGGVDLVLCGHSHSYERSFLLDGHYGSSGTLTAAMKKNAGDGRPAGNGAYRKPLTGPRDHFGAVYGVAGSSGQISGGTLNHPAHFISLNQLGSLVLDVNGTRLDATFVRENGTTPDTFTIIKQGAADTDGDGIPDEYEIVHHLNRHSAADALLDADGDGLSNLDEFILDLDAQTADRFAWTTVRDALTGQVTVTFPTLTGRLYRVWFSTDLTTWNPASANLPGTGAPEIWIDDGSETGLPPAFAPRRFYEVRVAVAP